LLCAQEDRVITAIEQSPSAILKGHVSPRVRAGSDQGQVPDALRLEHVSLVLKRSDAQQADLEQLIAQQRDPASAQYRKWLTPEEFADRFGVSTGDVGKITTWLESEGFTDVEAAHGRSWVTFSGTAGQFKRSFGVLVDYIDLGGKRRYANINEPSLPAALQQVSLGFQGLASFQPRPAFQMGGTRPQTSPVQTTTPTVCNPPVANGVLNPANFKRIYDVNDLTPLSTVNPRIVDGSFQTVAVIGQTSNTAALMTDVKAFRSGNQLPGTVPAPQSLPGTPLYVSPVTTLPVVSTFAGGDASDLEEADLDVEWAGAIAKNAQIFYVYGPNAFSAAAYAIDNKTATVLSMSFGICETEAAGIDPLVYRAYAQQANAEGITWLASSGDAGPAACDVPGTNLADVVGSPEATNGAAVMLPASIPEVTAVGGTEFTESATGACYWSAAGAPAGYIPEETWNDTALFNMLLASGGGTSKIYAAPTWQQNLELSTTAGNREVPDVAFAASFAHDPYSIVLNGTSVNAGGTSAATASFAGVLALLNQYLPQGAQPGLGNINPGLYSLAQRQPGVFHDITTGGNIVPCGTGTTGCTNIAKTLGFSAVPGYDQATGLGSLDVTQFVTHWNSGLPTTTTITLGPGLPFPNSLTANNLFQFDAVVAPAASGSGTASAPAPTVPTGAVNFYAQPTTLSTPTTTSPPASPTPTTTPPPILLCPLTIPIATGMPTVACPATPAQGLLPPGTYTVTAIYSGDGIFAGSESSIAVTVSAAQGQSNIVVSVPSPVAEMPANGQYNWTVPITLTNIGSVSTTLTGFTATGTPYGASAANFNQNLSGSIGSIFGTATITAGGSIAGTFETDNITPPEPVEFLFSGTDANAGPGNTASSWKTSTAVVFNGPSGTIGNVMNGASFAAVTVPVGSPNPPPDAQSVQQSVFAPGMIMSVFPIEGANLAAFLTPAASAYPLSSFMEIGSSYVQATISTATASYGAPLFYVSKGQINLQVPYELQSSLSATAPTSPANLVLNSGGVLSSYSFTVGPVSPGIFAYGNYGVWNLQAGTLQPVIQNSSANQAPVGSTVAVYYTGAGALSGAVTDGQAAVPSTPVPLSKVTLTLSGPVGVPIPTTLTFSNAAPANNVGVSMTPGTVGQAQAAFQLPANLAAGQYMVSVALQGQVGTGTTATLLPGLYTGNSVPVWVCTTSCPNQTAGQ